MNPITCALEDKIAFYNKPEFVENPNHPAGFKGTFAFSDHALIPEVFHGFLQRHFGVFRVRKIKLEKINEALNEVWEGPGSLEKIFRLEYDMYASNKPVVILPRDIAELKAAQVDDDDDMILPDEQNIDLGQFSEGDNF